MRKFVLLIMIVLSAGALALAQNKRISGTVKGVDGKPIAGAAVLVEGTSIGTTTNAAGRFSGQAAAQRNGGQAPRERHCTRKDAPEGAARLRGRKPVIAERFLREKAGCGRWGRRTLPRGASQENCAG